MLTPTLFSFDILLIIPPFASVTQVQRITALEAQHAELLQRLPPAAREHYWRRHAEASGEGQGEGCGACGQDTGALAYADTLRPRALLACCAAVALPNPGYLTACVPECPAVQALGAGASRRPFTTRRDIGLRWRRARRQQRQQQRR